MHGTGNVFSSVCDIPATPRHGHSFHCMHDARKALMPPGLMRIRGSSSLVFTVNAYALHSVVMNRILVNCIASTNNAEIRVEVAGL